MNTELFDYTLPRELIAQYPTRRRDQSRLMVLDRLTGDTCVHPFRAILNYLNRGDALVINTTKVFKARLIGRRATGAKVEVFLIHRITSDRRFDQKGDDIPWVGLVSPSRRVKEGERILFGSMSARLQADLGGGRWHIVFPSESQCRKIISTYGHVPLPHYIRREDQPADIRRYQTVFADSTKVGAVAAPTAGFHFTRPILGAIREIGVQIIETCLHVGPGTFKPVSVGQIEDHVVDPEYAELSAAAAKQLNDVRTRGGKVFAVGTTTVRTLESAVIKHGMIQPLARMVDLYIRPGYSFRVVDHLVTNFHLPRSSLLILVAAFAGRERILAAYQEAVRRRMRFYSYGDAMLIL